MKNTTKILGVVLAVFVALAVFAGAGAAAGTNTTIFPYTAVNNYTALTGVETLSLWADSGVTKINFIKDGANDKYYFTAPFKEGRYTTSISGNDTVIYTVSYPDAVLKLSIYDVAGSDIQGKTISKGSGMNITVQDTYIFNMDYLLFTTPAGGKSYVLGDNGYGSSVNYRNSTTHMIDWSNWYDESGEDAADLNESYFDPDYPIFSTNGSNLGQWGVKSGQWYVQAYFNATGDQTIDDDKYGITGGIPTQYLAGSTKYPFYVKGTDYAISADKDTVIRGTSFTATVSGPATTDNYKGDPIWIDITEPDSSKEGLKVLPGQLYIEDYSSTQVVLEKIPTTGEVKIQFDTNSKTDDKTYTLTAYFPDNTKSDVKVKVVKGGVTITTNAKNGETYIGNEVQFLGTNTETDSVYLLIKGVNKDLQPLMTEPIEVEDDHTWSKKLTLPNEFDAGTYTVYAVAGDDSYGTYGTYEAYMKTYLIKNVKSDDVTYETVQLTLLKPFLTAVPDQTSVAKGDKVTITGIVEGEPTNLQYYVVGTNYFDFGTISVENDGTYSKKIEFKKETAVGTYEDADVGEYFILVQHPMYDKKFNVGPASTVFTYYTIDDEIPSGAKLGDLNINTLGDGIVSSKYLGYAGRNTSNHNEWATLISKSEGDRYDDFANILSFATNSDEVLIWRDMISNMDTRQKANGAVALTDLINEEYVDDLYVAVDIQVASPWLIINKIADVTEGAAFKVDGTTNVKVDSQVSVEIMSTKFAAVSKIDVADSAYMMGTTKVVKGTAAGNTWAINFNNNKLNVDTYTVVAKSSSDGASADDTTTMKVVAKGGSVTPTTAPTVKPTTAPTAVPTTKPTAVPTATATPKSPGFGLIIALAGLGAAAVLLLRRE